MNLDPKTYELLSQLAEKLGTTVELLWQSLLKQSLITGYANLAITGFLVGFLVAAIRDIRTRIKSDEWDWEAYSSFFHTFCVAVFTVITLLFCAKNAEDIPTCLFNPEYYAFQQLSTLLK